MPHDRLTLAALADLDGLRLLLEVCDVVLGGCLSEHALVGGGETVLVRL